MDRIDQFILEITTVSKANPIPGFEKRYYSQELPFTREEVLAQIQVLGVFEKFIDRRYPGGDRIVLEEGMEEGQKVYDVFSSERGGRFGERRFSSLSDAVAYKLDMLVDGFGSSFRLGIEII